MKMRILRTLKICGHKVKVKILKTLKAPYEEALGVSDLTHNMIYLRTHFNDKPLEDSTREEVYWHEIVHFICELYGVNLPEAKVRQLGAGLYQVMRDNKRIFEDWR